MSSKRGGCATYSNFYDVSFMTSMRMRRDRQNLDAIVGQLEKQRKRSLDMFNYNREQTLEDLKNRVEKRSTPLSKLLAHNGKRTSIAISRRESLDVIHAHQGSVWNSAYGNYHSAPKKNNAALSQSPTNPKGTAKEQQQGQYLITKTLNVRAQRQYKTPVTKHNIHDFEWLPRLPKGANKVQNWDFVTPQGDSITPRGHASFTYSRGLTWN